MAMTMHLDIVSAEEQLFSGTVELVVVPGERGDLGIFPKHAQLIARLRPGPVRIKPVSGEEQFVYVSGGLLEVQPHVVTVLADTATRAQHLDEAAAIEARDRAKQALLDRKAEIDYAYAQAELAEAMAQLRTIENIRRRARV